MTGLNRSVMMYHRLLALSFLMVTTIFFATSCKSSKKKSTAGGSAPPTQTLEGDLRGDNCAAELTTVAPLPSASLTSLNLTSADVENVSLGGFKTAKIVLNLADGSGRPDRCIYYACSAKDKSQCVLGSSASCQDFNPDLPEGAINLTAWACVRPERVEGYPGSLTNLEKRKVMVGQETFYCGNPVTHYDNKDKNSYESDSIGQIQSLIKTLEDRRVQFGTNIVNIVKQYVSNHQGSGDSTDATWINIANLGDLSGETIALLYADAKSAASNAQGQLGNVSSGAGLTALGLNLSNSGEPCIPLPDPNTISNTNSGFSPPSPVTIPSTPAVSTETDDLSGSDGSETNTTSTTTPNSDSGSTSTVAAADYETKCKQRNEWFQSQNLGSTVWNKELNRCFHVKADGKQTEIDVSIDPDQIPNGSDGFEEVQVTDEETGMSGWQKTGAVMMAIGGVMGVAGAASYYYYGKGPGSKGKGTGTASTSTPKTVQKVDELVDTLKLKQGLEIEKASSVWGAMDHDFKGFQTQIDLEKPKLVGQNTKFTATDGKKINMNRRWVDLSGDDFIKSGGAATVYDPGGQKVTVQVDIDGVRTGVELTGDKAVASSKKLDAAVGEFNKAYGDMFDIAQVKTHGGNRGYYDTTLMKPDYKKYLELQAEMKQLGMPDSPGSSGRAGFAGTLTDGNVGKYQQFKQLETTWKPKHDAWIKAQSDLDLSNRIFMAEHISKASTLKIDPADQGKLTQAVDAQKRVIDLESQRSKFGDMIDDLRARNAMEVELNRLKQGSLDVPGQQKLQTEIDKFDLEWKARVAQPDVVVKDVPDTGKGGSYFEKLKAGDAPTRADAGMKGGLLGAAMFAVGGLMASGVLGLTQGSNLTQSITSDPNYIRNINDLEMINSLITGLQQSSSNQVINGSTP